MDQFLEASIVNSEALERVESIAGILYARGTLLLLNHLIGENYVVILRGHITVVPRIVVNGISECSIVPNDVVAGICSKANFMLN